MLPNTWVAGFCLCEKNTTTDYQVLMKSKRADKWLHAGAAHI